MQDGQVSEVHRKKGHRDITDDHPEPKVQGAILLQSLLRLSEPHNLLVIDRYTKNVLVHLHFHSNFDGIVSSHFRWRNF